MLYTNEQLQALQRVELEILKEVIRVCEENDIGYFTVGGTTLGAVRHNGFIPWDDDIDIGMLRRDYQKFLAIAPKKLKNGFTLTHFSTEASTPTYYAKVRMDGTEFLESYTKKIPMHKGVFIDIMPYDLVPEDGEERRHYNKRVKFWTQLYTAKTVKSIMNPRRYKGAKKAAVNVSRRLLHLALLPVPKKALFEKTDRVMRAYDHSASTMVSSRGNPHFESKKSELVPPVEHIFEDITVKIPADFDALLRTQYGDYMTLPPVEKRVGHAPERLVL